MSDASIPDVICSSRVFWFEKHDICAVFAGIRAEKFKLCDDRRLRVKLQLL